MCQSHDGIPKRNGYGPVYQVGEFIHGGSGRHYLLSVCVGLHPSRRCLAQEKKHSDPSRSCVSSECHSPIVKHKYLHGPLTVGQCTVCHAPLPGDQHKFKLVETEAKLCLTCHKRRGHHGRRCCTTQLRRESAWDAMIRTDRKNQYQVRKSPQSSCAMSATIKSRC